MKEKRPEGLPSSKFVKIVHGQRAGDLFVRRILPVRLHRVLGVPGLFATAYGNVGSSIYYALGVVAISALGLTPPVLILSGILFLFTGLTYAEGAAALPEAGGSGAFARRAFNDLVSFIASWALMIDYIVTISISAFSAVNYLGYFMPALKIWPMNSGLAVVLIGALAVLNIQGLRESSRLNIGLVLLDIATQVAMAVLGVILIVNIPTLIQNVHWGVAPTTSQLLFGISISMVAYTGIETIANLGSETRNPAKSIPRSVLLVFAAVLCLYSLLSMTALSAYPVYQTSDGHWVTDLTERYLEDPVMGIALAMPEAVRPILSFWVAILAVTILVIATNAGLMGVSRLAYFMGLRRQLPPVISQISARSRVPNNAILIFSLFAAILVGIGQVTLLVDLYSFGAMLAYTVAHVSVIGLRVKEPGLQRPFRIPLNVRIRGKEIPLPAVIGGLATTITWFIVVYTHEFGRVAGFAWLALGLLIYVLYRKHTNQPIVNALDHREVGA